MKIFAKFIYLANHKIIVITHVINVHKTQMMIYVEIVLLKNI